MTLVVPKEGPRAPLFFTAAALILFLPGLVGAQMVDQSALQRCAALPTAELKLACFEALAANGRGEQAADTSSGRPAQPAEAASDIAAVAASSAVVTDIAEADEFSVTPSSGVLEDELASAEEPPATMPVSEDSASSKDDRATALVTAGSAVAATITTEGSAANDGLPAVTAEDPAGSGDPMRELGTEHLETVAKEDAEPEEEGIIATVMDVTMGRNRLLYFHFENGQVWRQTEVRHFPYPRDQAFEVEIDNGMMGDYQMRVGGEGRMTRIKRVE